MYMAAFIILYIFPTLIRATRILFILGKEMSLFEYKYWYTTQLKRDLI